MYLPEYVCSEFNKNLDRDVFLGSKRYKVSVLGERMRIEVEKNTKESFDAILKILLRHRAQQWRN